MRRPVIAAAAAALFLSTACSAPAGAVVRQCQSSYSEAECTVSVEQLDKPATTRFSSGSSNRGVAIQATVTVETGQAIVRIRASKGVVSETTVAADQPAEIDVRTVMNSGRTTGDSDDDDHFFVMEFDPQQPTTNVSGSVKYQAITQAEAGG